MTRPPPADARTVAVIGCGVIGGGWAAHFLRRGFDVVAFDPGPGAADGLAALVDNAWPALDRLGLSEGASRDRLRFTGSLAEAVAEADFVQESAPEVLPVKTGLLAAIDAATPPDVVVASSSSGFLMSQLSVDCRNPERFMVGHPFNPPYLVPLVEVVGGSHTESGVLDWAAEFYTLADKVVLRMDREVPGFIGNRLQEALWREALHMVDAGEATVRQIDDAIAYGPGLRWALMGPMLTFHLAGGPGGISHMLDHFGPALLEPWTRLAAPELTPRLRDAVVAGVEQEAGTRTVRQLEAQRDAFLVDLLLLLHSHRDHRAPVAEDIVPTPFRGYRVQVRDEWIDYNGHLSDGYYAVVFSAANELLLGELGVSADYRAATGRAMYTVEAHLRYLAEVGRGDVLAAQSSVVGADAKRLRVHTVLRLDGGVPVATGEHLYVHVDTARGAVEPFPDDVQARVDRLLRAHADLERSA